MLEIKKSKKVQLDDKRVTFFLLGLLLAFTFLFVGLQYHKSPQGGDDLADNFATLGIPLIIDRSADEKSELAKAEWLKVYGAVFGCSKKTDQLYNKAVKAVKSKTK